MLAAIGAAALAGLISFVVLFLLLVPALLALLVVALLLVPRRLNVYVVRRFGQPPGRSDRRGRSEHDL